MKAVHEQAIAARLQDVIESVRFEARHALGMDDVYIEWLRKLF